MKPQTKWHAEVDYVIVGSGASGSTAAVVLSEGGYQVLVLEEGASYRREDFKAPVYSAMANLFRDFGSQVTRGPALMPILEGCCVGGSTVMNGAIIHRLPEAVFESWRKNDAGFGQRFQYEALEKHAGQIEKDLGVRRNLADLLPALPVGKLLTEKNWKHQAMARNAPGCEGSGRCLQGCPSGGKWSMEASYLPRAQRAGAQIRARHRVLKVLFEKSRAEGVQCETTDGIKYIRARHGVVLASGVLQTPLLLRRSGFRHAHLGDHFQCHLGIGIVAKMPKAVKGLEGPPQGIEITEWEQAGIKLATQLVPPELLLSRTPLFGGELAEALTQLDYFSSWTGSVKSEAEGIVSTDLLGKPRVYFSPTARDLEKLRLSLVKLSELLFEMGAEKVYPGVTGPDQVPNVLNSVDDIAKLEAMPLNPRYFLSSIGHLFGTARMGSDPLRNVVGLDYEVNGIEKLYVVDASLFPSNLGTNPQHAVMTLAREGALRAQAHSINRKGWQKASEQRKSGFG